MPGARVFSSPGARTERLDCGAEKDYKRGKYSFDSAQRYFPFVGSNHIA